MFWACLQLEEGETHHAPDNMTVPCWEWEQPSFCMKEGSEGLRPPTARPGRARRSRERRVEPSPQRGEPLNLCPEVSSAERCPPGPLCADSAGAVTGVRAARLSPVVCVGHELRREHVFVLWLLRRNIWHQHPKGCEPSGNLTRAVKSLCSSKISRWGEKKNQTCPEEPEELCCAAGRAPGSITEVSWATAPRCISLLPPPPPRAAALPWQPPGKTASSRPSPTISLGKL